MARRIGLLPTGIWVVIWSVDESITATELESVVANQKVRRGQARSLGNCHRMVGRYALEGVHNTAWPGNLQLGLSGLPQAKMNRLTALRIQLSAAPTIVLTKLGSIPGGGELQLRSDAAQIALPDQLILSQLFVLPGWVLW